MDIGLEMTEEDFSRLQGLLGGVREDFAGFRGETLQTLVGMRTDLTRVVGLLDGLAAKVERVEGRVGLLEAWRQEMGQMLLQAQQIVNAERERSKDARRGRLAMVGWIIAGLAFIASVTEWFVANFRFVR